MNLKPLNNTLHPRTTGFSFFVGLMRKYDLIDTVYDLTIGYQDTIPQNESAIFKGFPNECHVHLRRYSIEDLPSDQEALGEWLRTIWYQKDERLDRFYQNKKFEQEQGQPEISKRLPLYTAQEINSFMVLQAFVWIVVCIVSFYYFMNNYVVFWYTIFSWIAMTVITLFFGGLDMLEIGYWENRIEAKNS